MTPQALYGGPPPRIVVAEDSESMRDLLVLMLGHQGFDVVATADGDAALEAIRSEGADGVVSDLNMPNLDGLALCRVLRALRAYQPLPVVIFTGADGEDPRLCQVRDIAAVRVLSKPMGLHDIAAALNEMIASGSTGRAAATASPAPRSGAITATM
jgi:CheY-like chemotaxis protein